MKNGVVAVKDFEADLLINVRNIWRPWFENMYNQHVKIMGNENNKSTESTLDQEVVNAGKEIIKVLSEKELWKVRRILSYVSKHVENNSVVKAK